MLCSARNYKIRFRVTVKFKASLHQLCPVKSMGNIHANFPKIQIVPNV